jgi:peptide/nickel transport system substrate-binding protein
MMMLLSVLAILGSLVASQIARASSNDSLSIGTNSATEVRTVDFDGNTAGGPITGERRDDLFRMAHIGAIPRFPTDGSPANVTSTVYKGLVWDGLTSFDETKGAIVPALALSWRSADLTEWRFTLNDGATFGDGTPITASDVVYTLERATREPGNSLAAQELAQALARDPGSNSLRDNAIRAASPLVVVVTLAQPDAELPMLLASADLGIVPDGSLEASPERPMDSSGAYKLADTGADTQVLTSSDSERRFREIHVRIFGAVGDAFDSLQSGQLDWSPVPSAQANEALDKYGSDGENQARTLVGLAINTENPALADVRVRRAVFQALNVNDMVEVFGSRATIALSVAPREFSVVWEADPCLEGCRQDKAAASAVLKKALGSTTLKIDTFDTPEGRALAETIAAQLAEAGVDTNIRVTAVDAYGTAVARSDAQLIVSGSTAATASAAAFVRAGYSSTAEGNITGLADPAVDKLLDQSRRTEDPKARAELYGKAERLVRQAAVMFPIAQVRSATVFAEDLQGAWLGLDESIHFGDGF